MTVYTQKALESLAQGEFIIEIPADHKLEMVWKSSAQSIEESMHPFLKSPTTFRIIPIQTVKPSFIKRLLNKL